MAAQVPLTRTALRKSQKTAPARTTLGTKRRQWLECLHGKDPNSIRRQIEGLLWDLRSWWTINSARGLTPCDENGDVKGFGLLHGLLNGCFVTSQMVALRRLCDPPPHNPKHKPVWETEKGVWSLVWLLDDMKDNACLLTRKAIFRAEKIRYNLKAMEREVERELRAPLASVELSVSQQRHEDVDLLAGVPSTSRTANDQVRVHLFEALRSRLETTCGDTLQKVNKFIAHAATPRTRPKSLSSSQTPAALFEAARVIKQTFDFVSNVVLGKACPLLPAVELVDNLEYIECPLVYKEHLPQVRRVWDETKERLTAPIGDVGEFIKGLGL